MRNWDLTALSVSPHAPEIPARLEPTARVLSSSGDARAIVLHLSAGERLQEHEVRERAWVVVVAGEVEIETEDGTLATGGPGLLTEFEPRERHEVRARSDARLLLLLTPWPAKGHPGAMSLSDKEHVRERARGRAGTDPS
jgi:redox-sensitive bicupin YhaK (pirin superfamily)